MKVKEVKEKKTIQEWSVEKGIRVNDPKGFKRLFRKKQESIRQCIYREAI